MRNYLFLFFTILLLSCEDTNKLEAEIEAIPMEVNILRFDKEFAAVDASNLEALKRKYPVFFPEQFHDSIWLGRINDTLQQELNNEVLTKFPSEEFLEDQIVPLFQHLKYYFPTFEAPTVVTVTSDVDYQNKVIIADSLLVLSLDTYLGTDHEFYQGIKKYIAQNLKESQVAPDIAEAYARQLIPPPRTRDLLSQMMYYGKELYLKDLLLPQVKDSEKIGYTEEQLQWASENEIDMWRYFIENEMLFSTNDKLAARFIHPAPFSKFYLEIDNESPGMIGRYLGWQIVRSYMNNNDVSLEALLQLSAKEIYTHSKYKPAK
ncbi:gliding motility lipoprotein GldB [Jejudonia soesokkakensis]|uniref:Gliding motility lipoprotein GldB n=1 Tax=Jejudonia soesokkakensis TaxID=1323432 RepID=A0ABW2MR15_9FLAO